MIIWEVVLNVEEFLLESDGACYSSWCCFEEDVISMIQLEAGFGEYEFGIMLKFRFMSSQGEKDFIRFLLEK